MNVEDAFKQLTVALSGVGKKLRPYIAFFVFLFLAGIYAFMVLKISEYSNPKVGDDEVLSEVTALPSPKIDEEAIKKLQSLKDNSVNVQTLFEIGRENPFNE